MADQRLRALQRSNDASDAARLVRELERRGTIHAGDYVDHPLPVLPVGFLAAQLTCHGLQLTAPRASELHQAYARHAGRRPFGFPGAPAIRRALANAWERDARRHVATCESCRQREQAQAADRARRGAQERAGWTQARRIALHQLPEELQAVEGRATERRLTADQVIEECLLVAEAAPGAWAVCTADTRVSSAYRRKAYGPVSHTRARARVDGDEVWLVLERVSRSGVRTQCVRVSRSDLDHDETEHLLEALDRWSEDPESEVACG